MTLGSRLLSWPVTRDPATRIWLRYVQWYMRRGPRSAPDERRPAGTPDGGEWNSVLKTPADVDAAVRYLRRLGALRQFDRPKNWDLARAISFIEQRSDTRATILDIGCGWWGGMLLPSLARLGYPHLHGCDPLLPYTGRVGRLWLHHQDFVSTRFPAGAVDVATCLSVIEHGMDQPAFFREAHRVLKPNGHLLISTDYWVDALAAVPARPFGHAWRAFDAASLTGMVQAARDGGFSLVGRLDLAGAERVVSWRGVSFTFVFLVLRRENDGSS